VNIYPCCLLELDSLALPGCDQVRGRPSPGCGASVTSYQGSRLAVELGSEVFRLLGDLDPVLVPGVALDVAEGCPGIVVGRELG
jgi:hypothetical protein